LTDEQKQDIVNSVKQKLNGGSEQPEEADSASPDASEDELDTLEGEVIILEDEEAGSKTARSRKAIEFQTKKEFEEYKKTHKIDPHTKVKILEEQGGGTKKEEPSAKKPKPKAEPKDTNDPKKEDENADGIVDKKETDDNADGVVDDSEKVTKQTSPETMSILKDLAQTGGNDTARQIAVKDALIEKMGEEAAGWDTHKIDKSQLTKNVVIRFPDGTAKKFGDLTSEEQERVQNAIESGMAASKGVNDYNSVDAGTYKRNMAKNLAVYDDASVQEKKLESTEKVTPENAGRLASDISTNARSVIQKYAKSMSSVSRPMLENYVDTVSNAVREAVSDGSLVNVDEAAIDELVRDDVKRMIHQEVETRRRSLGDHGIRHATQNAVNTNTMLEELQKSGLPITGKDKLMAMTIQANHDNGYTVGDVATDITKGKMHKQYSADMAGQEMNRYSKIFGDDGAEKIKEIIGSHDENKINWKDDSVGSAVRLSDATALFGKEKVQDLFIREPKAMELVCRLRLAAEAEPDNKDLQNAIKKQMHQTIDKSNFDDTDKDLLHRQISEMSEGKFSTTVDILSRYSGRIKGFQYDPKKEIMRVDMKYSPEGQMVDTLFGDEIATKKFNSFVKDLDGESVRGKKSRTMLKSEGKNAVELNIDGFDEDPIDSASTDAMREFADKTIRDELNMARRTVLPPPEMIRKSVDEAFKYVEKVKDKFDNDEWDKMVKLFKQYKGNPEGLIEALKKFPLLKSEKEYLLAKTPGIQVSDSGEVKAASIAARVAARGLQVRRKDKDLMSDTGGTSKVREREPERKPPRDDMKKPHRTKDKPADERDKDTDNDKDTKLDKNVLKDKDRKRGSVHPLDRKSSMWGMDIPEENYYRRVWSSIVHIIANSNGISEKAYDAYHAVMEDAESLLRKAEVMEVVDRFESEQKRPEFCAECVYAGLKPTADKVAKRFASRFKKG